MSYPEVITVNTLGEDVIENLKHALGVYRTNEVGIPKPLFVFTGPPGCGKWYIATKMDMKISNDFDGTIEVLPDTDILVVSNPANTPWHLQNKNSDRPIIQVHFGQE